MNNKLITFAICSVLISFYVEADTIYKFVDALGNVTYSNVQPTDTVNIEPVNIDSSPKAEDVQYSSDNKQRLQQVVADMEQKRLQKQEQKLQQKEAKKLLQQAEIERQEVETPTDEDWQHTVNGRRFLKPSYFERIQAVDENLLEAERAFKTTIK
jgi:hypothetical protein